MKQIVLAVTGASGSIYAKLMIDILAKKEDIQLHIIFSDTAKEVWLHETETPLPENLVDNRNFNFPFASGSNLLDCMIILPCSMGSLARIASGISTDLISRVADVQLKERRKLLLTPRETPFSLIHLRNMTTLCEAGAIIAPIIPSYYKKPNTIENLTEAFCQRILQLCDISTMDEKNRW